MKTSQCITDSPLRKLFMDDPEDGDGVRAAAQLGAGHLALLLASGAINGVVSAGNPDAHVIRGGCRRRRVETTVTDQKSPDLVTQTTVVRDVFDVVIRTVDQNGKITTLLSSNNGG